MSTQRRLRLALVALIVLQLASWPVAMATAPESGLRSWASAVTAYALVGSSTLALALATFHSRRLGSLAWVGAVSGVVALMVGGRSTLAGFGTGYSHPSLAVSVGLALLICLEIDWFRRALVVSAFSLAYLVGVADTVELGRIAVTSTAANLATFIAVPLIGSWLVGALTDFDSARAAEGRSRELLRRGEAREEERTKQYRLLHDTVLSTLSALSRGSLDPKDPEVAQRLAGDADHLRGLIATASSGAGMFLVGELARLRREQAVAGLRVHQHISDVPDVLPLEVQRALADSINEALTNVVKHSGRREAWVTIVGRDQDEEEGVTVTITDRGVGFDPDAPRAGLGITRSLRARMSDVGGTVEIDSAPDQGTSVELRWPA